jgi:hypothetical protein
MAGTDTADLVPAKYDVVIDGYGYVTARAVDPNMPFRIQQENLSYTATFIERSNTSGNYGDNQQDFWLTASQNDWSLGDQQRFYQLGDPVKARRSWLINGGDPTSPGKVTLRQAVASSTLASLVRALTAHQNLIYGFGDTNLFNIDAGGGVTDKGAHGLGVAGVSFGIASDGANVYVGSAASGSAGVRKYDGTSYTTFSATKASSLCYANNTLYGINKDLGTFIQYDTGGVATTLFPFKYADGTARTWTLGKVVAHGGNIAVLISDGPQPEVWLYNGAGTSKAAELPNNFFAYDAISVLGDLYISGSFIKTDSSSIANLHIKPAVFLLSNGTLFELWRADTWSTNTFTDLGAGTPHPALGQTEGGVIWNDDTAGRIVYYDIGAGGVHGLGTYSGSGTNTPYVIGSHQRFFLMTRPSDKATFRYPDVSTVATSATVSSSLFAFDSSLAKLFRGVIIDADIPAGATVDIKYQLDSVDGSYTSLATAVASGTENLFPSATSGRSISIQVMLKKGSSTVGPTLKRVFVRAVPVLSSYRINEYILDLGGDATTGATLKRRDLSDHNLTGETMRANLVAAIQATAPISVTDRTGTFTAVLEPANCEFDQTRPGQWYARIRVREV